VSTSSGPDQVRGHTPDDGDTDEDRRERVRAVLEQHRDRNAPLKVADVAREAHVRRQWIYEEEQADLRAEIDDQRRGLPAGPRDGDTATAGGVP